jgi:predicted transcriptional regulator
VQSLVSRNFHGSAAELVLNLLETSPFKNKELDALEAHIREYRKKRGLSDRE